MLYVEPDFYGRFACKADECQHSCCVGWEIDIDEDTAEYYGTLTGEIGDKLRRSVSAEPEPHFILGADERCPFLRGDGLCQLIVEAGEDSLCDICREHPRFYNEFPQREERGLGLCCEEAVRLLLSGDEPLQLVYEGTEEETPDILILRQKVMDIFADRSVDLARRMNRACALLNMAEFKFEPDRWKTFYLGLERMDERWTELLNTVSGTLVPEGPALERIGEYMIYRHFPTAGNEREAAGILGFVILSLYMLAAIDAPLEEKLRLYSSEIEYSDENIRRIIEEMCRK